MNDLVKYQKDFDRTALQVRLPEVIKGNLLDFALICMEQVGTTHAEFLVFAEQINELVGYNSQNMSLTALLNKKFDPTLKRIRLENATQVPLKYKLSVEENALFYKYGLASTLKSYKFGHADFKNATTDTWNGIVWIPADLWPRVSEVRNVAEFYTFSGLHFIIKNISDPSIEDLTYNLTVE